MSKKTKLNEIKYFNRVTKRVEIEKIYGDGFIRFLYGSPVGKIINPLVTSKFFSQCYGYLQDAPASSNKVRPFIEKFNIDIGQYEPGTRPAIDIKDTYRTFNEFFIRQFKKGKRPFVQESSRMGAFAEARYVGFSAMDDSSVYPVKGKHLHARDLIANDEVYKDFEGGPLMIARLCPVDYHRYHYPDAGRVLTHFPIKGIFDSVNPIALKMKSKIFIKNERYCSILETENFGKIAYIEVGATCVGKIIQSHQWTDEFRRGEEKGYFLFGGSTVIILGQKGLWKPSADILENTSKGIETYLHLGDEVATRN